MHLCAEILGGLMEKTGDPRRINSDFSKRNGDETSQRNKRNIVWITQGWFSNEVLVIFKTHMMWHIKQIPQLQCDISTMNWQMNICSSTNKFLIEWWCAKEMGGAELVRTLRPMGADLQSKLRACQMSDVYQHLPVDHWSLIIDHQSWWWWSSSSSSSSSSSHIILIITIITIIKAIKACWHRTFLGNISGDLTETSPKRPRRLGKNWELSHHKNG